MQFNSKEYDPEKHDRWRALTVKQPYANDLVTAAYKDENGVVYGRKSIEVRSKKNVIPWRRSYLFVGKTGLSRNGKRRYFGIG